MDKHRQMFATVKATQTDESGRVVFEAMASTENVDRYGEIVRAIAFKASLAEHKKNGTHPKVLSSHSYWLWSGEPAVIGWSLSEEIIEGEGLKVRFTFAPMEAYPEGTTPLGPIHERFMLLKLMDSLSVGFIPTVFKREENQPPEILEADLLEYSPVAIPANKESLLLMADGEGMEAELATLAVKHLVATPEAVTKALDGVPAFEGNRAREIKEVWTLESLAALVKECSSEMRDWLGINKADEPNTLDVEPVVLETPEPEPDPEPEPEPRMLTEDEVREAARREVLEGHSFALRLDLEEVGRVERAAAVIEAKAEQATALVERLDAMCATVERLTIEVERVTGLVAEVADRVPARTEEDSTALARIATGINNIRDAASATVPGSNGGS